MMLCDELENKAFNGGSTAYELMEANGLFNTAKKVKAAIDELKDMLWDVKKTNSRLENELIELRRYKPNNDPTGIRPDYKRDNSSRKTQRQAIKEYLLEGHTITPLEALEMFGCFRLSAQIYELIHKDGLHIDCKNEIDPRTGKRYGTYKLIND